MRLIAVPVALIALIFVQAPLSNSVIAADAPKVVVSIKPIHSLISGIMEGMGQPILLISGNASPHQFRLKPSQARALQQADLVFWISRYLETTLQKPIESIKDNSGIIEIARIKGIKLLDSSGHDHGHTEADFDPHLWLDIANAKIIVRESVRRLRQIDPANGDRYLINGQTVNRKLDKLDAMIKSNLLAVKDRPYIVYHNAYRYLEDRYGVKSLASVVISADRKPGARRIRLIRKQIKEAGALCLFSEPQFKQSSVQTIASDSGIRLAELDPLGAALQPGPSAYFSLMKNLAQTISRCLGK